jgi:hypothetical protein
MKTNKRKPDWPSKTTDVYIRSRIGRYLCENGKFERITETSQVRRYDSIGSCIGAMKRFGPALKMELVRRGAWMSRSVRVEIPELIASTVLQSVESDT